MGLFSGFGNGLIKVRQARVEAGMLIFVGRPGIGPRFVSLRRQIREIVPTCRKLTQILNSPRKK
jgi:hypothetical protein